MMAPDARVAAYYAPRPDDPLCAEAASWLGRDPESGAPVAQPDVPDIDAVTAEPRLYGFHATLKPPMRLAHGRQWFDLLGEAVALANRTAPFALPPLAVSDVFGFLALRETAPCPPLQTLADACVAQLDPFRASPSDEELARRRRARLTPQQEAMLVRWGYPYVFESWFFHMTLTRRLSAAEKALYLPVTERYFARAIAVPRRVEDICLFVQDTAGAPFVVVERLPLLGKPRPRNGDGSRPGLTPGV
jgi:putative phosphonate metabolism protein